VTGYLRIVALLVGGLACQPGQAQGWTVDRLGSDVWMVYNDTGTWGGASMGTSHQTSPDYQTRKTLDLSVVPEELSAKVVAARVRVFFAVQDYSWASPEKPNNGMDEQFEVVVNGQAQWYGVADGFEGRTSGQQPLSWGWRDFLVPVDVLKRGANEVLFRKVSPEGKEGTDDYIYVGIDNTVERGTSAVSFDGGKTWTGERLNSIDARGEYMVRLVLITRSLETQVTWSAGGPGDALGRLDDSSGVVGYREADGPGWSADGLAIPAGGTAQLWFDREAVDPLGPILAEVEFTGRPPALSWLDDKGEELACKREELQGTSLCQVTAPRQVPRLLRIQAPADAPARIQRVSVRLTRAYVRPPVVDLCPKMGPAPRRPADGAPTCRQEGDAFLLGDGRLLARFTTRPGLALEALTLGYTDRPFLAARAARLEAGAADEGKVGPSQLFLLEADGKRLGSSDFRVEKIERTEDPLGFRAELLLPEPRLAAVFTATAAGQGKLRLTLSLANRGEEQVKVKTVFPHVAALDAEYYLFPYCGGIIADVPTYLRTAYGENTAWWQMIDVFRPADGCGLYVRMEDEAGAYKCPVLRKGVRYEGDYGYDDTGRYLDPELLWERSLAPAPGISVAFEHLRRTLQPGESLRWAPAVMGAHEGDWHQALAEYADWAHHVWKYRPYPGPLADRWNVTAVGWGQSPLVDEKGWRTDYLTEECDVAEMMSWWEWSDLGPWRVEMNHETLPKALGEALCERYKAYWVVDPLAGRLRYPLNRGDYYYNETWGGLEAFRKHIGVCKQRDAMAGVYIDGILACDTTEVGHEYGPTYGAMNPYWKDGYKCPLNPEGYVAAYGSWNMCCDTEWWAERLSQTVARIFRDTGLDYLRLDEFGHRGYPCYSTKHEHMFAPELGHNGWLQGCAEICRRTHALMDEIRPDLALTTEFPGTDHMAAYLDGSIVYEVGYHALPARPVVCNLLRFYFPECKPLDLDYKRTPHGQEVKLWNGMAAFGHRYDVRYLRLLREHSDAFGRGRAQALVPALASRVYSNRFSAEDKTVTALYNGRPYPVDGPLVELAPREGRHYVELLRGQALAPERRDGRWGVGLRLDPGGLALVADLPSLATVQAQGDVVRVRLAGPAADVRLVLSNLENERLAEARGASDSRLTVPQKSALGKPLVVKVFRGRYVADVVPVSF